MARLLVAAALVIAMAGCARSARDVACGPKGASYLACGCGCCGGAATARAEMKPTCIDTRHGETLETVRAKDRAIAADEKLCATVGCNHGTLYACCD